MNIFYDHIWFGEFSIYKFKTPDHVCMCREFLPFKFVTLTYLIWFRKHISRKFKLVFTIKRSVLNFFQTHVTHKFNWLFWIKNQVKISHILQILIRIRLGTAYSHNVYLKAKISIYSISLNIIKYFFNKILKYYIVLIYLWSKLLICGKENNDPWIADP